MEKQVLIFIKYLSSQMPFQSIADNYGVCELTVFNIVKRLSDVVCAHLLEKYIRSPESSRNCSGFHEPKMLSRGSWGH